MAASCGITSTSRMWRGRTLWLSNAVPGKSSISRMAFPPGTTTCSAWCEIALASRVSSPITCRSALAKSIASTWTSPRPSDCSAGSREFRSKRARAGQSSIFASLLLPTDVFLPDVVDSYEHRENSVPLNNKVCLVVGATGAIGRAIAKRFSHDSARLALTYHSEQPQPPIDYKHGSESLLSLYRLDITDWEQVKATVQQVEAEFSGIDVLVNCAGVIGPIGPLEDIDPRDWRRALEVNLMGAVHLARAVLPALRRRGHGKMIFFSGGGAAYGRPFFTAYSSAKTALVRFVESLAQEVED